jgi:hypothetical protein
VVLYIQVILAGYNFFLPTSLRVRIGCCCRRHEKMQDDFIFIEQLIISKWEISTFSIYLTLLTYKMDHTGQLEMKSCNDH